MARHCIGLNYESIGIENVGGVMIKDDLTAAQIKSNIYLVRYLVKISYDRVSNRPYGIYGL